MCSLLMYLKGLLSTGRKALLIPEPPTATFSCPGGGELCLERSERGFPGAGGCDVQGGQMFAGVPPRAAHGGCGWQQHPLPAVTSHREP